MIDLDRDDAKLDIHHIFPRKWCEDRGIPPRVYDSIVNKTAISYKANRMIGGSAPSRYLEQLAEHPQVKLDRASMEAILKTHAIDPELLRRDEFEGFYATRKSALLALVERAMGKASANSETAVAEDVGDDLEYESEEP